MGNGAKRFAGKSALITGAGGGIGRGISIRLAQEGADVAACDINEKELNETVKKIEQAGQKGLALICNVASEGEIESTVNSVLTSFGKIDILVNNAGIGDTNKSFDELDAALWDRVYAVNVRGPFLLSKLSVQQFRRRLITRSQFGLDSHRLQPQGSKDIAIAGIPRIGDGYSCAGIEQRQE